MEQFCCSKEGTGYNFVKLWRFETCRFDPKSYLFMQSFSMRLNS